MREVVTGCRNRGLWTAALLVLAVCACVSAAPALASSPAPVASGDPGQPSPAAEATSAAADASPATQTLTGTLSRTAMVFGGAVSVTGALTPAAEGQEVTVALDGAVVGTALTDASGTYALTFTPRRSGDVVASLSADAGVTSEPQPLAVTPRVRITHGSLVPFLTSTFVVKTAPVAYDGLVVVKVVHRGATVGTYKARARDGRATLRFPLRGVDGFTLKVVLPAAAGLAGRSLQTKVVVRAKLLSAGSSGLYVKGMLTALKRLRFRVPGVGTRFTSQVKDSVMAFQKAYRLPRTYVFNTACWRKIDGARQIRPRYASPATHIEVDKGRQILMIVKAGKPWGIICVSTGATGNTPEGRFSIQTKHPSTSSGFGGTLVRTMGFKGNFAIHGWMDVPPYPASHGCVREPIWVCYWTYDNSWVGERVYVYH
jgi:N-acetylmuramoyl-L-alanine amidase